MRIIDRGVRQLCLGALSLLTLSITGCPAPVVIPVDSGVDTGVRPDAAGDSGRDAATTPDGGGECATGCLVGTTCHPNGTVNPTNPCEICDHAESATAFSANDGASCDDGSFCTTNDECDARACAGTARDCGDSIDCNGAETCDETADACVDGTPTCAAGELCDATSGDCVTTCPGCAIGSSCYGDGQVNPTNPCEACDPSATTSEFSANDGASCDDGAFCTSNDVCADRACAGTTGSRCGDGVACNGNETCDETANTCVAGATTCSGAEVCDVSSDACVPTCTGCVIGGTCIGAGQRNPLNQCEACDPAVSLSGYSPNTGASCDDGLFCTASDVCTGTTCGGTTRACSDGIACNGTETCNETADSCAAGTSTCGGGTTCDPATDACVATCAACTIAGSCYGAGQVNPMNPCEVCRTTTPTVWSANDGATCNDGLFCTDGDRCSARACSGAPRSCSDGVACTGTETCNETTDACVAGTTTCGATQVCNTATDTCVTTCAGCVVGGTCFAPGTTSPTNPCQICDISRSRTAFSTNDGAPCDDAQFCTRGDVCSGSVCAGSSATNFCSDGVTCNGTETCNETTDACVAGSTTCAAGQVCNTATNMCVTACTGCVIGGVCYAPSTINPTNQCQICDPARSSTAFSPNTGGTCNDGFFCTVGDTCNASAVCSGSARACDDGVSCNGGESCNESTDLCAPGASLCPAGQRCDVPTNRCVITCAGCTIAGVCYAPGTVNGCLTCDTARSTTAWSNRADGATCDDGLYCTTTSVCDSASGTIQSRCVDGTIRNCADGVACNGDEFCDRTIDACAAGTTTCGPGTSCSSTLDMCIAGCPSPQTLCPDTSCTNLANDPNHCGSCSTSCPAGPPNTVRGCGGAPTACQYPCQAGFLDCNAGADGCEVSSRTDELNCGTCGNVCATGTADACILPSCGSGTCGTIPWCAFSSGGTVTATPVFGGGGGGPSSDRCPDGQVVMGYRGEAGPSWWVRRLQAVCGRLTLTGSNPYSVTITEASTTPLRGGSVGTAQSAMCPANHAVVGFSGRAGVGGYVAALQFTCAPITVTLTDGGLVLGAGTPVVSTTSIDGGVADPAFPQTNCAAGQVAVQTEMRSGSWIDQFGMSCAAPTLSGGVVRILTDCFAGAGVIDRHAGGSCHNLTAGAAGAASWLDMPTGVVSVTVYRDAGCTGPSRRFTTDSIFCGNNYTDTAIGINDNMRSYVIEY